jgi:hypothetical protein
MSQMLIANRLGDGLVVFRAPDGSWVESISDGELVPDEAADRLLAAGREDEANNLVIDPNLIAVTPRDGERIPDQIREAIRAAGPTIEVET